MKKLLKTLLVVVTVALLFPKPAYAAYLDPSVVTYVIQVVVGLFIAVGAVIYVYWRKAKQKVTEKLGINEDAKKEIEEDVIFYQSSGQPEDNNE